MLFLVISEPRAERPSEARASRLRYWEWLDARLADGIVRQAYPKIGRGMVAIFDVPDHETLSGHLSDWAEMVPAQFALYPLLSPDSVRRQLGVPGSYTNRP